MFQISQYPINDNDSSATHIPHIDDVHSISVVQYPLEEAANVLESVIQFTNCETSIMHSTNTAQATDESEYSINLALNSAVISDKVRSQSCEIGSTSNIKHSIGLEHKKDLPSELSVLDHSIKTQPYMDRISLGEDSLIDRRPISSSTPYHPACNDFECSHIEDGDGASFLPTVDTQESSEDKSTVKSVYLDNPKYLIQSAGVDDYISEGKRHNILSDSMSHDFALRSHSEVEKNGKGIILVGSNSKHSDLKLCRTSEEDPGVHRAIEVCNESLGTPSASLERIYPITEIHPGSPAVVTSSNLDSVTQGTTLNQLMDVTSEELFHHAANGMMNQQAENTVSLSCSTLSVQSIGTESVGEQESDRLSLTTESSQLVCNTTESIASPVVTFSNTGLDGLGYSTDSSRSIMSHQSLYSQEDLRYAEDIRPEPLLKRVKKIGIMILPEVTSTQLGQALKQMKRDETSRSDEVLCRAMPLKNDSALIHHAAAQSDSNLYGGTSQGFQPYPDGLSGFDSDVYQASGALHNLSTPSLSSNGSLSTMSVSESVQSSLSINSSESSVTGQCNIIRLPFVQIEKCRPRSCFDSELFCS